MFESMCLSRKTHRQLSCGVVAWAVLAALLLLGLVAVPAVSATGHSRPGVLGYTKVWQGAGSTKQHEWWIWTKTAAETVHAAISDVAVPVGNGKTPAVAVELIKPDGSSGGQATATGVGGSTALTASGAAGLWKARISGVNQLTPEDGHWNFTYDLWVQDGGTDKPGRVFADFFHGSQRAKQNDFTMYTVADDGTMFETSFKEYRGIDSIVAADGLGLFKIEGCVPTGASRTSVNPAVWPADEYTFGAIYLAGQDSACYQPRFNLFPDQPDPELPATARHGTGADAETVMVLPVYQPPAKPDPQLKADPAATVTAPFAGAGGSLGIDGFRGLYTITIDVNNNGSTADAVDRILEYQKIVAAGDVTWTWDGKDGTGAYVPLGAKPKISVQLVKGSEYYQVFGDVEALGGVQVRELKGYNASKAGGPVYSILHWDDSAIAVSPHPGHDPASLLAPAVIKTPPQGVSSQGYVHGWQELGNGSWGNDSLISIGTYADLAADAQLEAEAEIVYRDLTLVAKAGVVNAPVGSAGPAGADQRTIDYTVKIKNQSGPDPAGLGRTDFTAEDAASFTDTLPAHVTGWTYLSTTYDRGSNAAAASMDAQDGTATWRGPLKAGETASVTYRVTVVAGFEPTRVNQAAIVTCPGVKQVGSATITTFCPGGPVTHEALLPGLKITKSVDTAGLHKTGHTASYQVKITNIGRAPFTTADPAYVYDDLSKVLDDARLDEASLQPAAAQWDAARQQITWSGPLAPGASQTISYTVAYQVGAEGAVSDLLLENTAWIRPVDVIDATPGERVSTTTPGSDLHFTKEVDTAVARPGDAVTYTIRLDNTRGTTPAPVALVDELSGVLDDAVWQAGPDVSAPSVTAQVDGSRLVLGGSVAAGGSASVVYTVTVGESGERGDHVLHNAVGEGDSPPNCAPGSLACTDTPVADYAITKTVDRERAQAGEVVEYTLTLVNQGAVAAPVNEVDNLEGVLDDAVLVGAPSVDLPGVTAEFDQASSRLRLGGTLPGPWGTRATVTYRLKVRPAAQRGDHVLNNVLAAAVPPGWTCLAGDPTCTVTLVDDYALTKTVDRLVVVPGQSVTYTLTLVNTGSVDATVVAADSLAGVLDDAELVGEVATDQPGLVVQLVGDGGVIEIVGTIPAPAGTSAHITYTVQVKPYAERGDHILNNVVVTDRFAPPGGACEAAAPWCTSTPVRELGVAKTVDVERVKVGEAAAFTVAFTNLGGCEVVVAHHDLLGWVVDDGELLSAPISDLEQISAVWVPDDARIEIAGALAVGETVTIVYSVEATAPTDYSFNNYVVEADSLYEPERFRPTVAGAAGGEAADQGLVGSPPVCAPAAGMVCTVTPIDPEPIAELPFTGSNFVTLGLAGAVLAGLGVCLALVRRRGQTRRRPSPTW
ncbi:MAG: DUF11 domain-containing protein [Bifidobacteriaceae bacterium]|jgi:uncharacterized repeat protein (TIGR01451 family)|nr:DUF11 domain-containing protein [Bifidobacteriaceae bacterium]